MFETAPDYSLPEELILFRDGVRRFVERELMPLERHVTIEGKLPPEHEAAAAEKARAAGFWLVDVPAELGGADLNLTALAIFWEEIARTTAVSARDHGIFGPTIGPILLSLQGEMRERYLMPALRGERKACFAQTEPDAGSDPASMRTQAVRTANGWRITGNKRYITKAATADFAQVMAVTDPERGARGGISCFIVDMDTPGVRIGPAEMTMMGDTPYELFFDGVEVPASHLVGEEGMGFALAQNYINHGRIRHGAHSCGAMARCLELTAAYVKQRKTFGALLSDRQGVQWMLADGYMALHATRLMVRDAAARADRGMDARVETFMAKITGVESGFKVVDDCLQLHGGMGLTRETPLERYWRDLRSFRITEGPTEVLKTTMARSILRQAGL
ncbi:acyl-CoA dehydrogenase family protein [Sphingomonas canadensis]|uniref:Medium-chain specific acyl-CoA dehydrogenase, mitochondrial n=1 Tax=Sphingomonas canadensis TaxID=1219257 RepID=A0ABW3H763_9SPHN|nr:acyl-CoA dehydrogenase family protein [Sphingomonas canadensis]MCW3837019.1 acyl-CoA dehydrogenase family protein [Sphingomonas canadensis]